MNDETGYVFSPIRGVLNVAALRVGFVIADNVLFCAFGTRHKTSNLGNNFSAYPQCFSLRWTALIKAITLYVK